MTAETQRQAHQLGLNWKLSDGVLTMSTLKSTQPVTQHMDPTDFETHWIQVERGMQGKLFEPLPEGVKSPAGVVAVGVEETVFNTYRLDLSDPLNRRVYEAWQNSEISDDEFFSELDVDGPDTTEVIDRIISEQD